ncbi:MAG TPA: response regulator [Candidatus Brocadiia bacterium]|nr:response regulator [Candidatus Brocadiia bacterium]
MAECANILVIDDDKDVGDYCRMVLEEKGYAVRWASGVKEGKAAIAAKVPDLIILDVMMEEADSGFKFAVKLSQEKPGLPIIMLSSIADAASAVFDTTTLPVSELVEKPMKPDDLVKTVQRLLSKAGKK